VLTASSPASPFPPLPPALFSYFPFLCMRTGGFSCSVVSAVCLQKHSFDVLPKKSHSHHIIVRATKPRGGTKMTNVTELVASFFPPTPWAYAWLLSIFQWFPTVSKKPIIYHPFEKKIDGKGKKHELTISDLRCRRPCYNGRSIITRPGNSPRGDPVSI
jgi:hypothetical protein